MVDNKEIAEIISKYKVEVIEEDKNGDVFYDIFEKNSDGLSLTIQTFNGRIYCVYFLNNQYFEISNNDFKQCIYDILSGNYQVEKNKLNKMIITNSDIAPERISSSSEFEDVYCILPKSWQLK